MVNIYDNANEMASALQETQQFKDLKQAFDMLKLDTVAYTLFRQFQDKQMELQQKQAQGIQFAPDDISSLQEIGDKIKDIDVIKTLMTKEQALAQLMDELNNVISNPIAALYK